MNVGKRSVGVSVGTHGARYSRSSSGRRTATLGAPGTGLSYSQSRGGGRSRAPSAADGSRQVQTATPTFPLLAPRREKEFAKALEDYMAGKRGEALAHFKESSARDSKGRSASDEFFAGLLSVEVGDAQGAIAYLEQVVSSEVELPDDLMRKFGIGGHVEVRVTPHVTAEVGWDSLGAALILVECYQEVGRAEEAIGLLQQLAEADPEPAVSLSLCELLAEEGSWDEVVDAAAGVKNDDDVTLEIRLLQARGFAEQGLTDAALEAYKDALRSSKRSRQLLKEARYQRGRLLLLVGRTAQGRKDLEKVYADDPSYRDVAELVRRQS
jgi:tetratricopeptide (TPR) repeat protein